MHLKKFLLATAISFVAMFLLAYLWHVLLMAGVYTEGNDALYREEPLMIYVGFAYLVMAVVISYLYPRLSWKGGKIMRGLRTGMVVGLTAILPMQLIMFSVIHDYGMDTVLVDAIWHLLEQGIGGVVVAYTFTNV